MKKNLLMVVALFIFCMLQVPAWGQNLTISQIQQEIQASGAKWEAGETSMTKLSPEERKMSLGLTLPNLTGKESKRLLLTASPIAIPPTLDWRNNGGNYVTPVRNQGQCGSCWAFGTTAALESAVLLHRQTPNVNLDLSEQVMISCGAFGGCSGGDPVLASDYFVTTGLPPESCYPYTATYGNCSVACANWQAKTEKVSDWWFAGPDASHTYLPTVDGIKAALYTYGPLASTVNVYEDFFSYTRGIYQHVSGGEVGGHEISIIGYDDVNQCFIAKNSWGTGWGEAGFFRIAYSTVPMDFGDFSMGYYIAPTGCSYTATLDQSNGNPYFLFPGSGAKGTVTVTTGSGCPWTALSVVPWATITSGASGTGNGTVSFSLDGYPTGAARAGGLIVAGQNVFFQQQSQTPCTFAPWPAQQSVGTAGGNQSLPVTFTSGQGCPWVSTVFGNWVTATPYSGTGNGTLNYSVAPNTGTYTRTLLLEVAWYTGTSFAYTNIVQAGANGCVHTISPANSSFAASGGTGSSNLTTGAGCNWTATSNDSWLTVTSGASGSGNGTVNYSAAANTGATGRFGTLTIAGQTLTVYQSAGATCTYAITPTGNSVSSAAGTGSVSVSATTGCTWTATSNALWLTVTSGSSGTGNGSVGYSVGANSGTSTRTGTLTIAGQTFTVTQAAGGSTCTYSISPTSSSLPSVAGSGTVTVTAGSGCAWTAVSNNTSWMSITGGASGSGNGTVSYSVTANSGSSSRNGTLTVGGQTFSVNQAGQSCTYSISPTSNSFSAGAGTGSVGVTAGSGCSWTASSNATNFLTVTSGSTGSGNGTVNYSVTANTTTAQRTGTLTIAGQTFTVSQAGGSTCTYSISPTSNSLSAAAGSGSVSVTAPSGCTWAATSNATNFLTVTSGSSGSGNGTVNYSVTANSTTAQRTGTLTIAGQTFTVSQAAQACTYSISPTSNSLSAAAGSGSVSVSAPSGCTWTASSNNTGWLTVSGGSSGSGNGTVSYSVAANAGTSSRTGTMTIANQTFTATQAAMSCTYAISPTSNSFSAAAGTGTVTVTAGSGCAWTAVSNNTSWMSITGGASGSGNGTVSYSVTANSGSSSRTGTLTVGGQTLTVTQQGVSTCAVSLSAGGFNVSYASRQLSFTVNAASTCSWSASASAPWITFNSGATGKGSGTVIFTVGTNTGSARTGTISVNGSSLIVNQSGSTACTYVLSATSGSIAAAGGTGTVTVSAGSGCAWTAASNASWITVTGSGTGNGSVTYTVQANTGSSRTGTLTIAGQTFTVTQAGAATCSYTLNPANQNFSKTGGSGTVNVTAAAGCSWTAASNVSWLTVTPGIRGSGNGLVSYSVAANTGTARTGTLTIASQTFAVSQDGTSPTCQVSLSTGGFNFGYAARQGQFQVQAASSCSWNASASAPWITFNSGATGKGNGTVVFTIDTNMGAARTGTISVNGTSLTVNEQAHP